MTNDQLTRSVLQAAAIAVIGMAWAATKSRRDEWRKSTRYPFLVEHFGVILWLGLLALIGAAAGISVLLGD